MTRIGIVLLTLILAALTMTIAREWAVGFDVSDPGQPRVDAGPSAAHAVLTAAAPVDHLPEWAAMALARPMFSPSRRPDSAPAGPGAAAPDLPRLAGVMVGPFGKRAIFETGAGRRPVTVGEGDKIGSYVLRTIEDDRVTVVGPSGLRDLRPAFVRTPASSQTNNPTLRPDVRRMSLQRNPANEPTVAAESDTSDSQ